MTPPPAAPRSKAIVRALLGLHIGVSTVFCSMLALGVWREIYPSDLPPPGPPATVAVCVEDANRLRDELFDKLAEVFRASPAAAQERAFQRWSRLFRRRIDGARARCTPPAGAGPAEAQAVGVAFEALGHLHDLSELQVAHWARHVGPAADDAATALAAARRLQ